MQATTPMDPRALDAMMEYQLERYGNPHSRTHAYGWESEAVVEKARQQVADLIGASPKEVIYTSKGISGSLRCIFCVLSAISWSWPLQVVFLK